MMKRERNGLNDDCKIIIGILTGARQKAA